MNGFEWNWGDLNWLAIVVASASIMVVSPVWYMKKIFGQMWMDDSGLTDEKIRANVNPAMYLVPIATSFISVIAMALLINNIGGGTVEGLLVGVVAGVAIAAVAEVPHYTFAMQSKRLMLINTGQTAVTLSLAGLILGAWR